MALVLVVDDDATIRSLLREILQMLGHIVMEATDGAVCMACIESSPPDLVFMDIFMPNKDGFEAMSEILAGTRKMKIVAMSGGGKMTGGLEYLEISKHMGADRILYKPFSVRQIAQTIEGLLDEERAPDQG